MNATSSWFQRFLLPGLAFKAVVIGGGYATGRELATFFLPGGPWGGVLGMLLAMAIWSVVCTVTFVFAFQTGSWDYRSFFKHLLGPAWVVFEVAYCLAMIVTLAVFAAAAGAIGQAVLGWPLVVGSLLLMAGIALVATFGNAGVESLFKYVSLFLYATYAVFLVLALGAFGHGIVTAFQRALPPSDWVAGGLNYAGYNVIAAVAILPVLRHLRTGSDAVVAGLLAGPLAMIPAMLFFTAMMAYYPGIGGELLPSDFLLARLNFPPFRLLFQVMIFAALLESGTGGIHAINERIAATYAGSRGRELSRHTRLGITLLILSGSVFVATRIGLVALIANGYRFLAYLFLGIFVLPIMTCGVWRICRRAPARCGSLLVLAGLIGFGHPTAARSGPLGPSAVAIKPNSPALTRESLEPWLDGLVEYALQRGSIPGAVVAIVKDGRPLLEKGYGVSNTITRSRCDPSQTLFRMGSVSKLFTWTAVMQLVESGRLELDADVNSYLDFPIPPFSGQPITLRNLMTHTAGFEERVSGIAARDGTHVSPLGEALKAALPPRIYAPGLTPGYSNYGAALAGYIVARISRESFEQYVENHILSPLGMRHSTFAQPLPAALAADMAAGYLDSDAPAGPFEWIVWTPAGSLTTTAHDMSRFMIAHLADGQGESAAILQPGSARLMHNSALTLVPPLNRMVLGFYEQNVNGQRVIGHDGDTVFFHAGVRLYLDQGVGLFLAVNGVGKDDTAAALRTQFFNGFADRYYPTPRSTPQMDPATTASHADMFEAAYFRTRGWRSSFLSALDVLNPVVVRKNADGTISVSDLETLGGNSRRYLESAPFVWQEVDGHDRLGAVVRGGRIVRFGSDENSPYDVYDAAPASWSLRLVGPALLFSISIVLLTTVAWPIGAFIGYRNKMRPLLENRIVVAHRLARLAAVMALGATIGWVWVASVIMSPTGIYFLGEDVVRLRLIQLLTISGIVGGAFTSMGYWIAVFRGASRWTARLWSTALAVSMAALTWIAFTCHFFNSPRF